jgi:5-deoxy-D-glucuronate isomerase
MKTLKAGETLARENEEVGAAFVLMAGTVSISVMDLST